MATVAVVLPAPLPLAPITMRGMVMDEVIAIDGYDVAAIVACGSGTTP
jgi:hypothetical protein